MRIGVKVGDGQRLVTKVRRRSSVRFVRGTGFHSRGVPRREVAEVLVHFTKRHPLAVRAERRRRNRAARNARRVTRRRSK